MMYLTRVELKKLSALCSDRSGEMLKVLYNPYATSAEKALAQLERDFMLRLHEKLESVAESKARRIEITL